MPINLFGSSSNNSENRIDTSLFVQKPYLRTSYIEANIEEDIDIKNQIRIKKLPDPISIREAASKKYVNKKFNDASVIKNTTQTDFNDKNHNNVRFIKLSSFTAIPEHLTSKMYVDQAISHYVIDSSLLSLDPDGKLKLNEENSLILNYTLRSPKTIKKYVLNHMLIAYMKSLEIDEIYHLFSTIKIMNLIKIN